MGALTSWGARAPQENIERVGAYLIETLILVQLAPSKVMGDNRRDNSQLAIS